MVKENNLIVSLMIIFTRTLAWMKCKVTATAVIFFCL